jgi:hypothetical protein
MTPENEALIAEVKAEIQRGQWVYPDKTQKLKMPLPPETIASFTRLITALRATEAENARLREALEDIVRQASGRDSGWGHYTDGYAAGLITAANIARQALRGKS